MFFASVLVNVLEITYLDFNSINGDYARSKAFSIIIFFSNFQS